MITIKSEQLKKIKNLNIFFEGEEISEHENEKTSCLALWCNNNIDNPKAYPILRLIDSLYSGFGNETSPYSLIYSYQDNLYYNGNNNAIHKLLESDWVPSPEDEDIGIKAIQLINKYCISKYNQHSTFDPQKHSIENKSEHALLLIDQPINSESVSLSEANNQNFSKMFLYAFENFPNSTLYIKYHPDTINGITEGFLHKFLKKNKLIDHPSIKIIDYHCNIASIFYYVDDVFTVTSPVGFEALLRGKNVTTFGNSFYSGLGLTGDMLTHNKKERSLVDVFVAMFIQNTLYINPFNEKRGNILDLLEYISLQKRHQNSKHIVFFRTEYSKSKNVINLLNLESKENISLNNQAKIIHQKSKLILVDNQKNMNHLPKQNPKAFVSEGFLFPTLNKNKHEPISLILDYNAAYYNNKINSDLDDILNNEVFTEYEIEQSFSFISKLKEKFGKDLETQSKGTLDSNSKKYKKIIFVPGTSEEENIYSTELPISSDLELILAIMQKEKNSLVIYKPHEKSKIKTSKDIYKSGIPKLEEMAITHCNQLVVELKAHISHCINFSNEIHVINHNSGIEALIQGKKVVTYGHPFYAGRGLTTDLFSPAKDKKNVSLEKLILGALMLYPRYKIPTQKHFVSAKIALEYYLEHYLENIETLNQNWLTKQLKSIFSN